MGYSGFQTGAPAPNLENCIAIRLRDHLRQPAHQRDPPVSLAVSTPAPRSSRNSTFDFSAAQQCHRPSRRRRRRPSLSSSLRASLVLFVLRCEIAAIRWLSPTFRRLSPIVRRSGFAPQTRLHAPQPTIGSLARRKPEKRVFRRFSADPARPEKRYPAFRFSDPSPPDLHPHFH